MLILIASSICDRSIASCSDRLLSYKSVYISVRFWHKAGNMAGKCFLVWPPLRNIARKQYVHMWETWPANNIFWYVHLWETWLGNNISWFIHLWEGFSILAKKQCTTTMYMNLLHLFHKHKWGQIPTFVKNHSRTEEL